MSTEWLLSVRSYAGTIEHRFRLVTIELPHSHLAVGTARDNAQAVATITSIDSLLDGAAETSGGTSVGSMIGARACLSYDAATEIGGNPGTGLFTVAVAWQALISLNVPAANCANGQYGDETKRRTVSTAFRIADLI